MTNTIKSIGKMYFSFKGRINRLEFWIAFIPLGLIYYFVKLSDLLAPVYLFSAQALLVWPLLVLFAKRWHDIGWSGWYSLLLYYLSFSIVLIFLGDALADKGYLEWLSLLLSCLPFNFCFIFLAIGLQQGMGGENKFGEAPRALWGIFERRLDDKEDPERKKYINELEEAYREKGYIPFRSIDYTPSRSSGDSYIIGYGYGGHAGRKDLINIIFLSLCFGVFLYIAISIHISMVIVASLFIIPLVRETVKLIIRKMMDDDSEFVKKNQVNLEELQYSLDDRCIQSLNSDNFIFKSFQGMERKFGDVLYLWNFDTQFPETKLKVWAQHTNLHALNNCSNIDVFDFIRGKREKRVIDDREKVERLSNRLEQNDVVGLNTYICKNSYWKEVVLFFIEKCRWIIVDASAVTQEREGIAWELDSLIQLVPANKFLILCDFHTDVDHLKKMISKSLLLKSADSPNINLKHGPIRIVLPDCKDISQHVQHDSNHEYPDYFLDHVYYDPASILPFMEISASHSSRALLKSRITSSSGLGT